MALLLPDMEMVNPTWSSSILAQAQVPQFHYLPPRFGDASDIKSIATHIINTNQSNKITQ